MMVGLSVDKEEPIQETPIQKDNWVVPMENTKQDELNSEEYSRTHNAVKAAGAFKGFQFADNTTMHGLRYIFSRDIGSGRRSFWSIVFLGAMAYCVYVCHKTLSSYLSYPTVVKVRTLFERKSEFPAITICNYNTFRKSALTEDQQKALTIVFSDGYIPTDQSVDVQKVFEGINQTQFYYDTAFDYYFYQCFYKSKTCDENFFDKVLTDFGVCERFDPSSNTSAAFQTTSGQDGGIFLGTTFDPNEWTTGPHFQNEGFRIAIHEPGSKIYSLKSNGFSVQAGVTAEVVIKRKTEKYLHPPYGQCGSKDLKFFDKYTLRDCFLECETLHTVEICGCKFIHMPGPSPVCTFQEQENCRWLLIDDWVEKNIFDASKCSCPRDCQKTRYEATVINADPSSGFSNITKSHVGFDLTKTAVVFKVFYQDLLVTEEVEEAIYSIEKLLCDIGGAAGLFLGCSFITIIEFIDFAADVGWFWGTKGILIKQKRKEEEPPV